MGSGRVHFARHGSGCGKRVCGEWDMTPTMMKQEARTPE